MLTPSRPRYVLETYIGRVDSEFAIMVGIGGVDLSYEVRVTIGWNGSYRGRIESAYVASTYYGDGADGCLTFADRGLPIGLLDWLKSNANVAEIVTREWHAYLDDCEHSYAEWRAQEGRA